VAEIPRSHGFPKTAACLCGALTATAHSAPIQVHACCCLDCQRRSGSAFSYTAFFAEREVTVAGGYSTFRRTSEADRFHETGFCPTCGCAMFYRLEAFPGAVGIPAGVFADPAFQPPASLYWSLHRHEWLTPPHGVATIERQ
jgi:hypothetical protein